MEITPDLNFKNTPVIGELLLQSLEKANIFYSEILRIDEPNLEYGDATANLFPMTAYSHEDKKYPKKVDVDGNTTLIQGLFKDRFGAAFKKDFSYTVKIFVWVELEEENTIDECETKK
jgi:hypothetical protein